MQVNFALRHIKKKSKNYRSDENYKITFSQSPSQSSDHNHIFFNLTLFQSYILPIRHSSNHTFFKSKSKSYTLSIIHPYNPIQTKQAVVLMCVCSSVIGSSCFVHITLSRNIQFSPKPVRCIVSSSR